MSKFHYIYKTTCLITKKYYIGMHSTNNMNDGYLGSGNLILRSINKHGKENHIIEILGFFPDRKSLSIKEKEIVNEKTIKEDLCLNLKLGGEGGWENVNPWPKTRSRKLSKEHIEKVKINSSKYRHTIESKKKISESNKGKHHILHSEETKNKIRMGNLKNVGNRNGFFGKKHSEETKLKWSKARTGKFTITDGQHIKRINPEELDFYLKQGWQRGMKLKD